MNPLLTEWWTAPAEFAVPFLIAVTGVAALAWWVLRGERRNRALVERHEEPSSQAHHSH